MGFLGGAAGAYETTKASLDAQAKKEGERIEHERAKAEGRIDPPTEKKEHD